MDELYKQKPLLVFSVYTQVQADFLVKLGKELDKKLQSYNNVISGFGDTYGHFWLWLLGAYEVIRTLAQHTDSVDPDFVEELNELKRYLAEVRMPFAKQQYRGRGGKIGPDLSVVSIQQDLEFVIGGKSFSARTVIDRVVTFFLSIEPGQVSAELSN